MKCYCETFVSSEGFRLTSKIHHISPATRLTSTLWKTIATNKKRVECNEEYPQEHVEKLSCELCRCRLLCLVNARVCRTFESI